MSQQDDFMLEQAIPQRKVGTFYKKKPAAKYSASTSKGTYSIDNGIRENKHFSDEEQNYPLRPTNEIKRDLDETRFLVKL